MNKTATAEESTALHLLVLLKPYSKRKGGRERERERELQWIGKSQEKRREENLNDPRVNCFAVNTEIQSKTHLMGCIFYYTMLNN